MVSREDMEAAELDDNDIEIIKNVELTGDGYPLFNCFLSDGSYILKLDAIYLKLGGDISAFTKDLPEKEALISNALQILSDLIQAYSINEELSLHLAKPVLFLAIDEKSSVNSIKRAIHVFNLFLQNPSVICSVAYDESLEGSLQILGRKVPSIGDYECQALLFEALYRITCEQNREYWANIWFSDAIARTMFMNLDPQQFESNCRKALNYINRHETDRRVFSFIANTVKFGSFQLTEPHGCDFWIDFNYDSRSISFYCSELSNEVADNSDCWETILISAAAVKSYHIKIDSVDKSKKLVIQLNCPCHTLITSSNVINPALQSYEIIISFWSILDIHKHLEYVFEKDKHADDSELEKKRKISDISNAIQVNHEKSDQHLEISSKKRKISEASEAFKILDDVSEDQNLDISGKRKISQVPEAVQILEGVSEVFSSEVFPHRKVSHLTDPISVDAQESEDYIPPTGQSQKTRKISNASEVIKTAPESDNINNKKTGKEFYTSFKDINTSKDQPKKIRLYNLERAPVYDVPPAFKDMNSDENESISKTEVPNEDIEEIFDKRSIMSACKIVKDRKESPTSESKSNKQHDSKHSEQEVVKEKNVELYNGFPESDDDFQQNVNRICTSAEGKEASPQVQAPKSKLSSASKRKSELYSDSHDFQHTENVKFSRKPRRAAVTAMKKNKKIFDSTSEVTFDKDNVLDGAEKSYKISGAVPVKKRRHLKSHRPFNTDTETGSSEVSWMNKNKTCPLFETPKKSYSEWKRSKKRKLSVEILADINSAPKLHSFERKKKQARQSISIDSSSKAKSLGWSDLENFNLTVEKTTKRGSTSFMKMLESDLTSGSTNAFNQNTAKRSSQPALKHHTLNSDSNLRIHSKNTFEENEDDMAHMSEHMMCEDISAFNSKERNNFGTSKLNTSNRHDVSLKMSSKDCDDLNMDSVSQNVPYKKRNTTIQATPQVECDEDIHQEQQVLQDQVVYPMETIEVTRFQDGIDNNQTAKEEEEEGKHDLLERFLNSVSEYLEKTHDPSMAFTSENESATSSFKRRSSSSVTFSVKKIKNVLQSSEQEVQHQAEYDHEDESGMHDLSNVSLRLNEQKSETNQKKRKNHELLKPPSTVKKHKKLDEIENLNENVSKQRTIPSVDDLCSRLGSSFGMKSFKHMEFYGSTPKSVEHRKLNSSSKRFNTPRNSYDKCNMEKKLNGSSDATIDSLYSKHPRPTADSSFHMKNDKKWFDAIATTLSQDANTLTRKLLATVQKYVCEYSSKMKILRKNIAETAKVLEAPIQNTASENKLKGLIKNCKMIRSEVEKSLRKMHSIGSEYFQAEQKCYRKLRKKHIKASRKYISGMKQATKKATAKLEESVLTKSKSFLIKFWKMIDNA